MIDPLRTKNIFLGRNLNKLSISRILSQQKMTQTNKNMCFVTALLTHLCPALPFGNVWPKLTVKISYESVDEKSLTYAISENLMKNRIREQMG